MRELRPKPLGGDDGGDRVGRWKEMVMMEATKRGNGGASGAAAASTVAEGGDGMNGYERRRIRGGGKAANGGGDDGGMRRRVVVVIGKALRREQHSEARAISLPPAATPTGTTATMSTKGSGSRELPFGLTTHTRVR